MRPASTGSSGGFGGGNSRSSDNNQTPVWLIVLAVSIIVYVISFILIRTISRYREYAADRGSALITGAPEHLSGRLVFFAVPAEEYGDIEWRVTQARDGKLEFLGGKPELLRLGHFDDVDLSMMIHMTSRPEDGQAGVPASNNGCIVKTIRYVGRAAHAGGAPHLGVNATVGDRS